jgi:hypothetical protein
MMCDSELHMTGSGEGLPAGWTPDGLCADGSPVGSDAEEEPKTTYKAGEKVTVTSDDEPWATVVVSKVKQVKSYKGKYFSDKPKKGHIYIQAYVTYRALTDGVDYNQFDWQVFAGDTAVDELTFVSNGPEPQLSSGSLPNGRKAAGWVVYEVPVKGKIVMSYGGNQFLDEPPVFEVVLRAK